MTSRWSFILSAYVAEFNREVNDELTNYSGYDTSEKIYVDFEGAGEPDNYWDILAVYMVKYGNGDTATDMTDKAKENLKSVFEDMCSYTITSRTDTSTDEEGNTTSTTVKEVNVKLKTYHDMISEYGFDEEEQEMLAELMKPENLAMMGYTGGGGDPGDVADYLKYVDMDTFDSRKDVADSMIELGRTLGKKNDWSKLYFAGNKSVVARFCVDDRQLMKFLKGFYNSTDQEAVVDEKRCSRECLNKLAELGMDTRGKASIDSLSYTRLDTVFEQGQTNNCNMVYTYYRKQMNNIYDRK